jgi:indolepyruvate ferredoxin oxidoreductase beta subunit
MRPGTDRPLTMLIGALGGEGGGVLADWIVEAATRAGMLVQSTSIPGVAQRTGATTYYLEMMRAGDRHRAEPVFALYPAPGCVDVVITTELVEAGRAIEKGFVTPDLTTLVSSTHRTLAIGERSAMGDGAFDASRILEAGQKLARRAVLADFAETARAQGLALNALLLGALAACEICPIAGKTFEQAINSRAVAVDANIKAFRAGMAVVNPGTAAGAGSGPTEPDALPSGANKTVVTATDSLRDIPEPVRELIAQGAARLTDYHDRAYADLYQARLQPIIDNDRAHGSAGGFALSARTARYLTLWMAYEDVIRVADLKTRPRRMAEIRREALAKAEEPVRVTEFLKPGLEEAATILPAWLGGRLVGWAERRNLAHKLHFALRIRTDTILGYALIRMLARFKWMRKRGHRYAIEQALIGRWLAAIEAGARHEYRLGVTIADLGRLIKGYSDTRVRAFANFNRIFERIVDPALAGAIAPTVAAGWVDEAHKAALADDQGVALQRVLEKEPRPDGILEDPSRSQERLESLQLAT